MVYSCWSGESGVKVDGGHRLYSQLRVYENVVQCPSNNISLVSLQQKLPCYEGMAELNIANTLYFFLKCNYYYNFCYFVSIIIQVLQFRINIIQFNFVFFSVVKLFYNSKRMSVKIFFWKKLFSFQLWWICSAFGCCRKGDRFESWPNTSS